MPEPTLLGYVGAVAGGTVSVRQAATIPSGIAVIGGKSYRIGQVGTFVRIPQGYQDLYGIMSEVGASATPRSQAEELDRGERWMTVQLVGEIAGTSFERGISQYPNINDEVHLVVEEDLARLYGDAASGSVIIGRLSSAEGIPVRIELDKLVTRHCAVLGSTGAGKSTAVASLLRSIASGDRDKPDRFPSARLLVLDIHGEYGRALGDVAKVFRIAPGRGEYPLVLPYWALPPADLIRFLMGALDEKPLTQVLDRILAKKAAALELQPRDGIAADTLTVESPVPYSLRQLWLDLIEPEIKTWLDTARTQPALDEAGDAATLRPPKYKPATTNNSAPYQNNVGVLGIRRALDQMRSRLLDRQFEFLLRPGEWNPDLDGHTNSDLSALIQQWLGHDRPVTILDLSGIPSDVLDRLIGTILQVIYDALFWSRDKSEGGIQRPILIAMEEAHRYVAKEKQGPARDIIQRIVKEGRKFGVGAMIISQRPSEVDETILSQCGTFITLRLSNSVDRARVQSSLPDSLAGVVESLPVLRTGEAIITGEAARLPIRCKITLPSEERRPSSEDPEVTKNWGLPARTENYDRVVASWRSQNARWTQYTVKRDALSAEEVEKMQREAVLGSTSIVSVGYDTNSETLEIEFVNGTVYQYFNVPSATYEQFMQSDSKGQYHAVNIRNQFAYSRV